MNKKIIIVGLMAMCIPMLTFADLTPESKENNDAATVLYDKGITKVQPAQTAFYETITRAQAAMLAKRFAVQVLKKTPTPACDPTDDTCTPPTTTCSFNDISNLAASDQSDILAACQLGIMKGSNGQFKPNDLISRNQVVIITARLISQNPSLEKDDAYDYLLHLGIVKVDDRQNGGDNALRKDLYIMLHRIIVSIGQISAYTPYIGGFSVGSVSTTSIDKKNNATQVLKVIAYEKDKAYNNYTLLQLGSAVLIAKDKIITNAHVVLDDNDNLINNYEICRTISSQSKPVCFTTAQVLYYDKTADLAILKLQSTKGLPAPVTLATNVASNGDEVQVRGYPGIGGNTITYTKGVISGVERDKYKSDVKIDHGNSGGGAFDKNGKLIGIPNSVEIDSDSLAYIIPTSVVQSFLKKQGDITMNESTTPDPEFAAYIQGIQAQKNNTKSLATPIFTFSALGGLTLDNYVFDADLNLYNVALSTNDTYGSIYIQTSTTIGTSKSDPNDVEAMNKKLDSYCSTYTSGLVALGGGTWEEINCQNGGGNKNTTKIYDLVTSGSTSVTMYSQNRSSSKQTQTNLDTVISGLVLSSTTVSNTTAPTGPQHIGPITTQIPANGKIEYSISEDGSINPTATIYGATTGKSEGDIYSVFWQLDDFSYATKGDTFLSYCTGRYESYLTGSSFSSWMSRRPLSSGAVVKSTNNAVFFVFGYESKFDNEAPSRNIIASTLVKNALGIYRVIFDFSYDGAQNKDLETKILQYIDSATIDGDPALSYSGSTTSLTSVDFLP